MTAGDQLLDVLSRAAKLPGTVSMNIDGNEDLLRHLSTLAGAAIWGIVAIDQLGQGRVVWSVAVVLDGLRVNAVLQRAATDAELGAVDRWQKTDLGARAGFLRRLVGEEQA